uniref:Uncharacterized protein n=1 Tax=Knipowitschia caucasica TaxID=637954 RepID=A0AAV2KPM1_KNICA
MTTLRRRHVCVSSSCGAFYCSGGSPEQPEDSTDPEPDEVLSQQFGPQSALHTAHLASVERGLLSTSSFCRAQRDVLAQRTLPRAVSRTMGAFELKRGLFFHRESETDCRVCTRAAARPPNSKLSLAKQTEPRRSHK